MSDTALVRHRLEKSHIFVRKDCLLCWTRRLNQRYQLFHFLFTLKQCAIKPVTDFKSAQYWTWVGPTVQFNKQSFLCNFPGCCEWMLSETYARLVHKVPHSDKNVSFLFINPLSGRLITLGDAAAFTLVCLSLCFQPRIKMPSSAGYHGASSLLSAHFNPADFSSWCFISVFPCVCLFFLISLSEKR